MKVYESVDKLLNSETKDKLIKFLKKQIIDGDLILIVEVAEPREAEACVANGRGISKDRAFFKQVGTQDEIDPDTVISLVPILRWNKMVDENIFSSQMRESLDAESIIRGVEQARDGVFSDNPPDLEDAKRLADQIDNESKNT